MVTSDIRMKHSFIFGTVLLGLGCSSSTGAGTGSSADSTVNETGSVETGAEAATDGEADAALDAPVPCGVTVGDKLCDLPLRGFLRNETSGLATSVDLTEFKLSDALAMGTQKYAFVFDAAFW